MSHVPPSLTSLEQPEQASPASSQGCLPEPCPTAPSPSSPPSPALAESPRLCSPHMLYGPSLLPVVTPKLFLQKHSCLGSTTYSQRLFWARGRNLPRCFLVSQLLVTLSHLAIPTRSALQSSFCRGRNWGLRRMLLTQPLLFSKERSRLFHGI